MMLRAGKVRTERLARKPLQSLRRPWHAMAIAISLVLVCVATGCSSSSSDTAADSSTTGESASQDGKTATAREWLERMASTYRGAKTYQDAGQLRFRLLLDNQPIDETVNFTVAFERPSKMRLHVYQASLVSDGKQVRATVAEPELQNQLLEFPVTEEITMESLIQDEVLRGILTEGIAGGSPQLSMLLTDEVIKAFLDGADEPRLLTPMDFDGKPCQRVEVVRKDGALVVWIDRDTLEMRRLDYPVNSLREEYAKQGTVGELALWAEFNGAVINAPVDQVAFQFDVPEDIRVVKRFMPVQPPQPPSKLLGKQAGEFEFTKLDGEPVTKASLAGKVVILDLWATWCQPCLESLPNLQKLYDQYRDNPDVAILAVNIDAPDVENTQVEETFKKLGLTVPIVRDTKMQMRELFLIDAIPNLLIMGKDGVIEDSEVGFNPKLDEALAPRITALLDGKTLHEQALARYDDRKREYEQTLEQMQELAANSADGIPRAKLAPASKPNSLELTKLWSASDIKQPGNILVVPDSSGDSSKLYVLDGWKSVAEVDLEGKVIATHDLGLPEKAVASYLRTAIDKEGRRYFLAGASNQPQFFVFDENWKQLYAFPPEDENAEVMDAQLTDLDGDGKFEACVGYWQVVGVQGVSLEGKRDWQNRSVENVTRLAITSPDSSGHRSILCANSRGTIATIDFNADNGPDIVVPDRFIRWVTTANLYNDERMQICGIALTAAGTDIAVGVEPTGGESWHYLMPAGVHEQPVEIVTSGRLLPSQAGQWLLAGADGSIHVLSVDGQLLDKFSYGARLCGVAVTEKDQKPLLLVATTDGLDAWQVNVTPALGNLPVLER